MNDRDEFGRDDHVGDPADPGPETLPALPERFVVPMTGEVIDLNDAGAVVRALREIRQMREQLNEVRRIAEEVLVEHSRRAGTKTLRFGDIAAVISGGEAVQWDVEELWKLRDAGLPEERLSDLVTTEISYKVNAAVAKSIASANPDYAEIIERARVVAPAPWRVSVKAT